MNNYSNTPQPVQQEETTVKFGGWLNEFLWICSGVNRKILRQCPTDYAKYAGIGGTILFTALMATLSGGYAFSFVFDNSKLAIGFGIFWGLLIFNLDRLIVNTMYSDGKPTISWLELWSGLPRIVMAIFLGIVISTPLEMKIFEDRINTQILQDNSIAIENNIEYQKINHTIDRLTSAYKECQNRADEASQRMDDEWAGRGPSGIKGDGKDYRRANSEYKRDTTQMAKIQREQDSLKSVRSNMLNNIKTTNETNEGFCVRYEAFSNLKRDENGNPNSLFYVSLFIALLFVIIEITPTIFKMMISSGPYDDILRAEMHKIRIISDKKINDLDDCYKTDIEITTKKNEDRLTAELQANQEVLNQLSLAQSDLIKKAIQEWKKQELEKIHNNPSNYINSGI